TRSKRDWSSDVCSSDLTPNPYLHAAASLGCEGGGAVASPVGASIAFNCGIRMLMPQLRQRTSLPRARVGTASTRLHARFGHMMRSEEHTSELQSRFDVV